MTNDHCSLSDETSQRIRSILADAERENGIRILYACESGSRAWGMASSDSDYDVRFIYAHGRDWYLSVLAQSHPDTIDTGIKSTPEGVIDCSGWDVRKALGLMLKSNGPLLEWLHSPIVYASSGSFRDSAIRIVPDIISPNALWHHYRGLRDASLKRFQSKKSAKVWLYAMRPQLAMLWIEHHLTVPPVPLPDLSKAVLPAELLPLLADALEEKRIGREKDLGFVPDPALTRFMEDELPRRPQIPFSPRKGHAVKADDVFRTVLAENIIA